MTKSIQYNSQPEEEFSKGFEGEERSCNVSKLVESEVWLY